MLTLFPARCAARVTMRNTTTAKHIVTWLNGSTTRFAYCDGESTSTSYQGAEYLFIGVDELTHFTLKQWQFLTSRNRCRIKNAQPCMAGATNPGNVGHAWVKALWVDRVARCRGWTGADQYDPDDYEFVHATIADNPYFAGDDEYKKTLGQLPEALRRAFLDGEWDVYAGQYFDIFSAGRHTVRAEQVRLEPWTPRWISIDWGFEHPSAVYWHATRADGVVVTYREFVQNRLSPRMLAAAIAERSVDRLGRAGAHSRYLSFAGCVCAADRGRFDCGSAGRWAGGCGVAAGYSGRQRSRGRLDADVPGAGGGSLVDRRQLRAAD